MSAQNENQSEKYHPLTRDEMIKNYDENHKTQLSESRKTKLSKAINEMAQLGYEAVSQLEN